MLVTIVDFVWFPLLKNLPAAISLWFSSVILTTKTDYKTATNKASLHGRAYFTKDRRKVNKGVLIL